MRKKPALLEDIPDPPLMGRDAEAALGIEQNRAVHDDASPARTEQAGDRVYDGSLAGSRTAEQRGQTAPGAKVDVEREIGEPVLDIDFEHRLQSPERRRLKRLASRSAASSAINDSAIETRVSLSAPKSPPGVWVRVYIAEAIVRVSPGMLETNVIVAPNSPRLRANDNTMPATIPGAINGNVTSANTNIFLAPSVPAASSSLRSTASSDSRMARTSSGKPITAQASAAPVQRNAKTIPKDSSRNRPSGPLRPNSSNSR